MLNFCVIDRVIVKYLFNFSAVPGSLAQFITCGSARFLVSDGFKFHKNNGYNGREYWLCQGHHRFGCSVRVTTKNDIIKSIKGEHNHPSPFESFVV